MNRMKKLALTFSLAVAGVMGIAAGPAQAQSVTASSTATQTQSNDLVQNNYVAPAVYEAVGQLPMNNDLVFGRAKTGFTTAYINETGENVAVQYSLNGNQMTPIAAYNLDDTQGKQLFQNAVAQAREDNKPPVVVVQRNVWVPPPVIIEPVYYPTYTYVRPVRPVVWYGGYGHHNHYPRVITPRVIVPPFIINIGGGHHNNDHYRGNDHRGNDHRGDNHRGNDRGHDRGGPRHHR